MYVSSFSPFERVALNNDRYPSIPVWTSWGLDILLTCKLYRLTQELQVHHKLCLDHHCHWMSYLNHQRMF